MAFSPDGQLPAGGVGEFRETNCFGEVKLWDLATGKGRQRWKVRDGGVAAMTFAPDGKALVVRSYGGTVGSPR